MSQQILLKSSATSGKLPTTSSLLLREIAMNSYDGKIYMHKSGSLGNQIVSIVTMESVQVGTLTISGSTIITGSFAYVDGNQGANKVLTSDVNGHASWQLRNNWVLAQSNATMSADTKYVTDNTVRVVLTLPTASLFGQEIEVMGSGSGGWRISQNSGQQIFFGNQTTTLGFGGFLQSTNRRNVVKLVCTSDNLDWTVASSIGNISVT